MAKKTNAKKAKKNPTGRSKAAEPALPGLVEAMAKLVERIESVERKTDLVLSRVGNLPSEIGRAVQQRGPFPSSHEPSRGEVRAGSGPGTRMMYQAVCADCSKNCEVPFKPGSRPVYCKECWAIRKAGHVPNDPDRRISVAEQKRKSVYTPSALSENAIPTLPGNVSVFSRAAKLKKKAGKKAAVSGKKKRR